MYQQNTVTDIMIPEEKNAVHTQKDNITVGIYKTKNCFCNP